ncbi:helix-turn-helix domain-containing protein [Agrobacterium sp. NPDC058088]|uniref:helix-turn-helix domain-containing protein n=1 Tax=Agrobacterium sp. NPDC058088 TaxID=3346335 RepID=UPI0036DE11CF
MTKAIGVYHGPFGRATLFHLDRAIIPHAHREGHLLFHVCGSEGRIRINGVDNAITPTEAVAVNPWELHEYKPDTSQGQYIVVLYIRPTWFNSRQSEFGALRFASTQFSVTPDIGYRVNQLAELLASNTREEEIDCLLYDLTRACFITSYRTAAERSQGDNYSSNDFRVRKSMVLMSERLDRELDVAQLATDSGLSRPHFFKLFRAQMGITPKLFWNTLRLEKAFGELVETPKPICDISYDLGFSSQSSFSRFFCLNTGMAPTDYRRVGHVISGGGMAA